MSTFPSGHDAIGACIVFHYATITFESVRKLIRDGLEEND